MTSVSAGRGLLSSVSLRLARDHTISLAVHRTSPSFAGLIRRLRARRTPSGTRRCGVEQPPARRRDPSRRSSVERPALLPGGYSRMCQSSRAQRPAPRERPGCLSPPVFECPVLDRFAAVGPAHPDLYRRTAEVRPSPSARLTGPQDRPRRHPEHRLRRPSTDRKLPILPG